MPALTSRAVAHRLPPVVRCLLAALILVGLTTACARTRVNRVDSEVGGVATDWKATETSAGLWEDQATLSDALHEAVNKIPAEVAQLCKGQVTRIEVVVLPPPRVSSAIPLDGRQAVEMEHQRVRRFVQAAAERKVGSGGCIVPPNELDEKHPAQALARLTVDAWGWEIEAVEQATRTVRRTGNEVRSVSDDGNELARLRARASVHFDVFSGPQARSAKAEGDSPWRVMVGRKARIWPLRQLPVIYDPPARVDLEEYEAR